MNDTAQQKTIDLARGLFLIRYESGESASAPPFVRVFPDRGQAQNCTIITAPDATEGTLYSPESALVVSVRQPCRLIIEVNPLRPGGSTAANLKIETLNQGRAPQLAGQSVAAQAQTGLPPDLRVMAHVAGIGDVTESPNAWIAGPTAPARIEGLCLVWPGKPADLDIRYAVRFARPQAGDNQFVALGTFAGTRGRALPLTGFSLELSGPGAFRYNITAETIFLGAPANRISGQRVNLSGPTGREPLVGIKIDIENVASQPAPFQPPTQTLAPPPPAADPQAASRPTGRVRVFRSRQASAKPTG
jgi:hypothetical protein